MSDKLELHFAAGQTQRQWRVLSAKEQLRAYREARKLEMGPYNDKRRFLSDPPLDYRKMPEEAEGRSRRAGEDEGAPPQEGSRRLPTPAQEVVALLIPIDAMLSHSRARPRADAAIILRFHHRTGHLREGGHEVEATVEIAARSLFGQDSRYPCGDLRDSDGEPAGFAVWFFNYSTWQARNGLYLEDLYVTPEQPRHRRRTTCCCAISRRIAVEEGCGRFEWSVLDWNEPAIRAYRGDRRRAAERMDALPPLRSGARKLSPPVNSSPPAQRFSAKNCLRISAAAWAEKPE